MNKELKEKISELLDTRGDVVYKFNDEKEVLIILVDYSSYEDTHARASTSYIPYLEFTESNAPYNVIINSVINYKTDKED